MLAKNLRVGDKVGVKSLYSHDGLFGTVNKINGHGHITVKLENDNLLVFDKHGQEKGSVCRSYNLVSANYLEGYLEYHKELDGHQKAMEEIVGKINNHRNANGQYFIYQQQKDELLALLQNLQPLSDD